MAKSVHTARIGEVIATMDEMEMATLLQETIGLSTEVESGLDDGAVLVGADLRSFEEAMVLTNNAGFVLRLTDGSEFQVTVVQSK